MNVLIFVMLFIGLGQVEDWFKRIDIKTGLINSEAYPIASVFIWILFAIALYGAARLDK